MTIRVGAAMPQQHADYRELRDGWAKVEELGADTLWNWDHFYPLHGHPDGKHFECFTLLAAMAEVTERIEFGALVVCNSYRNPNLVADMARTIDHMSEGRHILGLGSGWFQKDYDEYGYEFGTAASRLRDLDANLPVIRGRLAKLNPPPVRDVPILIGGGGEKVTLRITAEHADMWNGMGDADTLARKNAVLDEWCARVGRDPADIERTAVLMQPEHFQAIDKIRDAGITHFIAGTAPPPFDFGPLQHVLAWRDQQNA